MVAEVFSAQATDHLETNYETLIMANTNFILLCSQGGYKPRWKGGFTRFIYPCQRMTDGGRYEQSK